MKTLYSLLTSPGKLEIRTMDREPKAKEVLVKVSVCGLCSWELKHFGGLLGKTPMTLGHEWAGTVVALGHDVTEFSVGDHVAFFPGAQSLMEGFAQYVCADVQNCFLLSLDADMSNATLEPLKCIVTVLRAANAEIGDVGVVVGCGVMGLWCIQGLPAYHMKALIAVDVNDERLALAKRFGATRTINPLKEDAAKVIAYLSDGRLADFVIEGSGSSQVLDGAIDYVGRQGRLVVMSSYATLSNGFDFRKLCKKGARIVTGMPNSSPSPYEDMRRAVSLFNAGVFQVAPVVTHRFRLEDIQTAFETLKSRPAGYIKGVVEME